MDHICQAHPDREALAEWYADLAGFLPIWKTPIDAIPDMADLVLNIPGSSVCWEIIMPRGEDSFIDRFLARNGTSVHRAHLRRRRVPPRPARHRAGPVATS